MNISVVMIAKNAAQTLEVSLESLKAFDEVILYLNDSEDTTKDIAEKFNNVKVVEGDFLGFGPTKNKAASFSKHPWVFSLDSDEIIPKSLIKELQSLTLQDENEIFIIKRDNYFFDKKVNHSGWGKDFLVRLYNKNSHQFNEKKVHEKILLHEKSKRITLNQTFKHLAIIDISQFLSKINSYSKIGAADKKTCFFLIVLAKSLFAFIKTYFLQLGFLDGYRGFVIAFSDANGRFYRYLQRYINCKQ